MSNNSYQHPIFATSFAIDFYLYLDRIVMIYRKYIVYKL